ncbi:MAG: spore coat protein [marine bacterium B5-7]|nr:MAG: spore coat protein [marine bacterium B5-7]
MVNEFLPFSKPCISSNAINEVVDCLQSGWITTGPRVKRFEMALQRYFETEHALTLSSATAGLHLALLALDLKPGDEVITTPMTFIATLNTIVLAGGKPVLADVDLETRNINVEMVTHAVTSHTRAIVPVHFAGLPVNLDPLYELAQAHGLRVIEDAAHAIGAEFMGSRIGAFGDIQVFSFHPNKNMTTGEGGCVTTRDSKLAERISLLRFHGIDREAWDRFGKTGSQHYEIAFPGFKYNMMDIQAAIGLHQLAQLEQAIERRTELALRYRRHLKDWPQWSLPVEANYPNKHAWHLFAPLLNPDAAGMHRDDFMMEMKKRNIGTGLHYSAAHLYQYYRDHFGYEKGDFPNAEFISDRIVSLPLFPAMTDDDQDRVIFAMAELFKGL